jgi:excisionase family DNA binding protein
MSEAQSNHRLCLSITATATALSVGRRTVYRAISDGSLQTITLGRRRLVPIAALNDFVQAASKPVKPGVRL